MTYSNDINQRQNEAASIKLLKAAGGAHRYAEMSESARLVITLASLAMAIAATLRADAASVLALIGVFATVVSELLRAVFSVPWSRTAMLLQERFDTELFGLPWKQSLGRRPPDEDVHHWSRRFRKDSDPKENWYVDVTGIPKGHAALICQRQNLSWDARLRGIWSSALLLGGLTWIGTGIVIGFFAEWRVSELVVRWLAPSSPALVLTFRSAWSQRRIAAEKKALIDRVESLLQSVPINAASADTLLLQAAREIQDDLARLRSDETRVPGRIYRWYLSSDEEAAASAAKSWRDKLLRQVGNTANDHSREDTT